jgi:hypothetical protein
MAIATVLVGIAIVPARGDDAAGQRHVKAVAAKIDREVANRLEEAKIKPSALADDAEFLRRACLDITGHPPTAERAAAFLDSKESDKRAKLIDELLAKTEYGRHLAIIWRTMLTKRDETNRFLNARGFEDWLAGQFNANEGWDEIVYEILTAEGETDKNPAGVFFQANREMNRVSPAKVTGAVANMFLGIQLQCAECHNHPFVRQWKHTDFWGMAAFFGKVRDTAPPQQNNRPALVAKIEETTQAPANQRGFGGFGQGRIPAGPVIAIPSATQPGRTVGTARAKFFEADEPKLDKMPYRPAVAEWITSGENKYFARAMVNRMWAHFFARGIVNPIEDMHEDNEPTHPELLKFLTEEFVASEFDLKHLIRCIANSQAYQRTSAPTVENKDEDKLFSHQAVKVMSAEVLYDALTQVLGAEPAAPAGGFGRPGAAGFGRGGPGGGRQAFVRFFDTRDDANDATDSGHGIPQYLRLMNSGSFNRGSKITEQLAKDNADPKAVLEKLFLTVVGRRPTASEVDKMTAYLAKQSDTKKGYDGVFWVLVNSAEFMCIR